MLPTKYGVSWPFGSGEEAKKIDFQDGRPGGQFGFRIGKILVILICKTHQSFLPSFKSSRLSVQEKKRKIDFQDGGHCGHLGFPIGSILAIFYLQVTLVLPTKFEVNWPFGSGVEAKNRFSRRSEKYWGFQDGRHGGNLGFQIRTILAIFDLQATPMLPTKLRVNWPFGLGEKAKNIFSRWPPEWIYSILPDPDVPAGHSQRCLLTSVCVRMVTGAAEWSTICQDSMNVCLTIKILPNFVNRTTIINLISAHYFV